MPIVTDEPRTPALARPATRARVARVSATLAANEALDERRQRGERVLPMAFGEAGVPVAATLKQALAMATHRNRYGPVAG
ncbi:MAG TPA: hypothetical protein VF482_06605, partial [Trebonia sp.]